MTDQATRVVPAGWYEDPASSAHVRWWNGLAWTEHTTLKPTTPPRPIEQAAAEHAPVEQTPAERSPFDRYADGSRHAATGEVSTATGSIHSAETLARIAEARELERQYGISTAEHDIIVRAATTGVAEDAARTGAHDATATSDPAADYRGWRAEEFDDDEEEPGTSTASSWFIALWPVLTLVAAIAAAYVAFYVTPEPSIAGIPIVAGVVLVPFLLTIVWAATDARRLRANGHRPASPALAVLGPLVYLVGRRVRVPGSGQLVTLIVLTLLVVAGPLAAVLTGAAAPATKALEIQQVIRADLVGSGELTSVNCPIFVESLAVGSLYDCQGIAPDGTSRIIWVSIDDTAGGFSYAFDLR